MSGLSWHGNDLVVENGGEVHVLGHVIFLEEIEGGTFSLEAPIFLSEDGEISNFSYGGAIPEGSCISLEDAKKYVLRSKATEIMFVLWMATVGGAEPIRLAHGTPAMESILTAIETSRAEVQETIGTEGRRDRKQSIVIAACSFLIGAALTLLLSVI